MQTRPDTLARKGRAPPRQNEQPQAKMPEFSIVLIPHDIDSPISERTVAYEEATKVNCLIENVKPHFKRVHRVCTAANGAKLGKYTDMITKKALAEGGALASGGLDPSSLAEAMSSMQLVDMVALLPQQQTNGWPVARSNWHRPTPQASGAL